MHQITRRLKPGSLLKESIIQLVDEYQIQAGTIAAMVGGLDNANLRLSKLDSGEHSVLAVDGPLEIISCMGTLSTEGSHIHISVADRDGRCYGGHLKDGCKVFVTVELVLFVFDDIVYKRVLDDETGYEELVATEKA